KVSSKRTLLDWRARKQRSFRSGDAFCRSRWRIRWADLRQLLQYNRRLLAYAGDSLNSTEKVGIVLSGGGARAAYEVGVLKAIFSGKCPAAAGQNTPEVFCGTGAGAFNAAVIASRLPRQRPTPVEYLESLWADEIPHEGKARNNRVYRRRL